MAYQKEKALFSKKEGLFECWLPSDDEQLIRTALKIRLIIRKLVGQVWKLADIYFLNLPFILEKQVISFLIQQ